MFKPGDEVRCINNKDNDYLRIDEIYTISEVNEDTVFLEEYDEEEDPDDNGFFTHRFVLISQNKFQGERVKKEM